ncbi:MAG: acid phosphatase [Sphingomonadaceae bacterium]|nr:acid phosphatase [Sphingomonadaceae bacterium]
MMRHFAISLVALALAGCAAQAERAAAPTTSKETLATQIGEKPAPTSPPPGQQWLYGSAEGTIASVQVYRAMTDYILDQLRVDPAVTRLPYRQVILAMQSTPAAPRFDDCGNKPFAAVFDADETLIWNVGSMRYMAEQGKDFDPAIWDQWERSGAGKALAMPGAVEALKDMRDAGVTIVVNTNRTAANAKGTEDTLRAAGLGEFKHGETLYLMGDDDTGSSKDARRAAIAARYCVIAMAGDQLGDFSNAFNAKGISVADRRKLAANPAVSSLWGSGWFLLSNPVYGPSIRGSFDDIFTPETKWEPAR